jgi:predicted metalloprotease
MEWTPGDRSNIEDERGRSGFGIGGVPIGIGGFLLLLVLSWLTGTPLSSLFHSTDNGPLAVGTSGRADTSPAEERQVDFVDAVMKDVQDSWRARVKGYEPTRAVLFRDAIQSACGFAQSATGPFYCPQDEKVYLDLGFFQELQDRFGARGDFARAYVLAHEIGHHIQRLTGVEQRVRATERAQPEAANQISVLVELQADCYAGVWGHVAAQPGRAAHGQVELEPGDADDGLRAAAAIGDDRLQRMTTGHIAPDRFTHGTSAQRVEWFRRGLTEGNPERCDTFAAARGTR